MAALNNSEVLDECAAILGIGGSSTDDARTSLQRAANHAGRMLWGAHYWPERLDDAEITTIAPYSTGTAAGTGGSASITGSGTTWSGWGSSAGKFARSLGDPPYVVSANGGNTALTLARNYLEDDFTGGSYVLYADEYNLATDLDELLDMFLVKSQGRGDMREMTRRELDRLAFIPGAQGEPREYAVTIETTALRRRVRIYPVPDDVYALRYVYAKAWTDLSSTNAHPFDQDRERLWIRATVLYAQSLVGRVFETEEGIGRAIEQNWSRTQPSGPRVLRRRAFDHPRAVSFYRDLSGLTS